MNKAVVVAVATLLVACGNGRKASPQEAVVNRWETEQSDTVAVSGQNAEVGSPELGAHKNSGSAGSASYSGNDDEGAEPDNLRGFDPASEDDMDDNGMGRYFDNYDDEGWE